MPRRATFLRPVTCSKCDRAVADYWQEPDGYPWVVPRRTPAHEGSVPVEPSVRGLPPGHHEHTFTFRCECGATPSYRTSQIAALAKLSPGSADTQPFAGHRLARSA